MFKQILVLALGMTLSALSAAAPVRVNPLAMASITDLHQDGVPDFLDNGYATIGDIRQVRLDGSRVDFNNISMCWGGGCTNTASIGNFYEFDVGALINQNSRVTLNFSRFNTWGGGAAYLAMGDLAVSIYSGDGNVTLADYVTPSIEVARVGNLLSTERSKAYAVDVTEFILAAGTPIVGIRFDLRSRGGAYLTDQGYAFQGAIDFERTAIPFLRVETASAEISNPSTISLFGLAFGLLITVRNTSFRGRITPFTSLLRSRRGVPNERT